MKTKCIGAVMACVVAASMALAGGFVESYRVNAQYRGTVKKGFQDVGTGKVSYDSLGAAAFRVRAMGTVKHPNEPKTYSFNIHQRFEVAGNNIRLVAVEKKELNRNAAPHERRICEVFPFAYLVRYLTPPLSGGDPALRFLYAGTPYTLRYRRGERHIEAELYRNDDFLGKFFLLAETGWRPASLEKFRIALPEEDMVVSFIVEDHYTVRDSAPPVQ